MLCGTKHATKKYSGIRIKSAQKRDPETASPVKTRRMQGVSHEPSSTYSCLFCDKACGSMQIAASLAINKRVTECATKLMDTKLLAKLAMGDMHAIDAKYHLNCLVYLYNRAAEKDEDSKAQKKYLMLEAAALAELVTYVGEVERGG